MTDENISVGGVGRIKKLFMMVLFFVMLYMAVHLYFIWRPVQDVDKFGKMVMNAEVAGVKIFPAVKTYNLEKIDGRREILKGEVVYTSPLMKRLKTGIARNEPVTFTEKEINRWLRKRLQVKQEGLLGDYVIVKGVWVNLTENEVEIVIERELEKPKKMTHITSLVLRFKGTDTGFRIYRPRSYVGQVEVPGGFARLIMPAFSNMVKELREEMLLYIDKNGNLKIHDVRISEGKITFDPRLKNKKG